MSYGYGIQVSVLQLARAYTMFTNNGAILPVTFRKLDHAPQGEQLIKPETAKAMREMVEYGLTEGQKISDSMGYIPLPAVVVEQVRKAAANIK